MEHQYFDEPKQKKTRKVKKNRIPKLPNEVIVIKNAEKDVGSWMESWDYPKNGALGILSTLSASWL